MHIAHLETGRHLYGGARQVLYLLEGLGQEGVQSTLICPPESAIAEAASKLGLTVETMPMSGDLDAVFGQRLARWLKDHQPDLLHVHSRRGADMWGGVAARQAGTPAVLSRRVDNPDFPIIGKVKYRLYERVIAISAEIRSQLHVGGVPNSKLRLVHSAVAADLCQPTWSREKFHAEFGLQDDELAVICVGQLIPRKGQAVLLDAWPSVLEGCPRARLIVFGQGASESDLRAQVERQGLGATVNFAGFRNDLRAFLGHADLLVHPALREGLGICLLEAQAAAVPIVASRAGGIPEAVADGISGLLVQPEDPAAIAAAVVGLLADAEQRAVFGQGGREHVAKHFSQQAMVSGNLAVYRELLQEGGNK
jgi:glycosyltransferase involved in cell wall biosynthesis